MGQDPSRYSQWWVQTGREAVEASGPQERTPVGRDSGKAGSLSSGFPGESPPSSSHRPPAMVPNNSQNIKLLLLT